MNQSSENMLHLYLEGNLTADEKLEALLPHPADGCELLVACRPEQWSASSLARAVEDCDASVLTMTVTAMRTSEGLPVVLLRTDSRNAMAIERSLARYGFTVIHSASQLTAEQRREAMARLNELAHYLEL